MKDTKKFESYDATVIATVDTDSKKVVIEFALNECGHHEGYGIVHCVKNIEAMIASALVEVYADSPKILGELFIEATKEYTANDQNSILQNLEKDKTGACALSCVFRGTIGGFADFKVEFDLDARLYHVIHQASEYDKISNPYEDCWDVGDDYYDGEEGED